MGLSALTLAAAAATLTIGFRDARADYIYECIIFVLAAWCCMFRENKMRPLPGVLLAAFIVGGFLQLAFGATVYRFVTLQSSLRYAALAATAWIGCCVVGRRKLDFLRAFAWLGMVVAVLSVLAYFTSPGKILWLFPAPYPDVWGPFLSRNNFAQFLELAMPAALWLGLRERKVAMLYILFAAIMLAAGLASASRAGAAILVFEAMAVFWIRRQPRIAVALAAATIAFAALPGVGHLLGRLSAPDPYQGRREIARSTLDMIGARPWTGFGLGTYATVYPAYAQVDMGQAVEHAHNDWLEWTTEGGIPFLALWIGLLVWAARPAVRSVWGIGVVGCFLHGLVDYPFARLGIAAWVFLLLGILAATDLREVRATRH